MTSRLDNGYSEALIIYNGKTIEGVGGGVCQVSTTLFRTAFFAGFPIEERHPHAYRVSYYEKTYGNKRDSNLAGLGRNRLYPACGPQIHQRHTLLAVDGNICQPQRKPDHLEILFHHRWPTM